MKINIGLFILCLFFTGCKQSAVRQNFSGADSLVIYFKNESVGEITKTVQTTEKKAINRIIDFMDGKETELYKCGHDAKMFFYKEGTVLGEADLKMKDNSCNHFVFLLNDKLVCTSLSNEAVDFFVALESGLPYY